MVWSDLIAHGYWQSTELYTRKCDDGNRLEFSCDCVPCSVCAINHHYRHRRQHYYYYMAHER